jgi:hypothetical protein
MGRQIILSENEKLNIQKMYGLINEQSSNAEQVGGPFNQKNTPINYYIFQDDSKFYIYMTNASQKEPKLFDGEIYDNKGQGYSNQVEAEKMIEELLNDTSGGGMKREVPSPVE